MPNYPFSCESRSPEAGAICLYPGFRLSLKRACATQHNGRVIRNC